MIKSSIVKTLFLFSLLPIFASAVELKIVTEQYPPYNYEENGKVKGVGTEVVRAILKEAKLKGSITVYPWARSLKMAIEEENTLIYCISRTKKREKLYTWIGVIAPINFYMYSLKSRTDIKLTTFNDARKYKVGIVFKDALEEYFTRRGFKNLDLSNSNQINMKKLIEKRIEIWPISELTGNYLLKKNGYSPQMIVKKIYPIKAFGGDQYLAISKSTSVKIINDLRAALKRIKDKGIYQDIISKYL